MTARFLTARGRSLITPLAVVTFSVCACALANPVYEIFPARKKQTILGLGVEIQSDSIGSGNHGLPDAPIAVPHDLTPSERERFAREMLQGFRYLRLAGGLYWRGLDAQGKQLRPRWPEQLTELQTLVDQAGIEGLSFEYWSPAPYWKANRSYVGRGADDPLNTLRPFAESFPSDTDYKGDRERFFRDFAQAVVTDIRTLEAAKLKVSMFGLQNEPWVSNSTYSANHYPTPSDYLAAFRAVAGAVRRHDPDIMIFSDTAEEFPRFLAPGLSDPDTASLVDAYAVHTIGYDSATVARIDARIRKELPPRPWFQNEYEYLTGGATRARTLNTVQHIMNSFQIAGNPTWFWLHALKPVGNAEASGYALGFWNSQIAPAKRSQGDAWLRWQDSPPLMDIPADLARMELVYARPGDSKRPAVAYEFRIDRPARVWLLVEERGKFLPEGWTDTGRTFKRSDKIDRIYARTFAAGSVKIPSHDGVLDGIYGPPHAAFVEAIDGGRLDAQVGVNSPVYVRSKALELEKLTRAIAPGHWTFNNLNWNAVGSFVKRLPWDSVVLEARAANDDNDARLLVFQRPEGKRTLVLSNRKPHAVTFNVDTNLDSRWRGYRYTPHSGGARTMGIPVGSTRGEALNIEVPPQAWEFWEEE